MLSTKDIKHLAKISDLKLTDSEVDMYCKQLGEVLDYIKILDSIDTKNVQPTFHVGNSTNRFQSKENYEKETLSNELALKNAKKKDGGYIVGKSMLKG